MSMFAPLALVVLSWLSGAAAVAIWFVSDAHGHGLASGDRTAIIGLGTLSALAAVGAVVMFVRRRG